VPNGTLFGDGICARIKEELLKDFDLHTIVRLPNGVFAPYHEHPDQSAFLRPLPSDRRSLVLRAAAARRSEENYTKTQPIQFEEFAGCLEWWQAREENDRAWKILAKDLLEYNPDGSLKAVNLDRKNPNAATDFEHLPPEQLVDDILKKEQRITEIIGDIKRLLAASA